MLKTSSNAGRRAWSLVRLTLLRARKGGLFRRRLMVELSVVPKFLKNIIGHTGNRRMDQIGYMGEHELSFDKTPVARVKMNRPHSMRFLVPRIPCVNPDIDFDYDFGGDGTGGGTYGPSERSDAARKSFIADGGHEHDQESDIEEAVDREGIDLRAEEFIAKFYEPDEATKADLLPAVLPMRGRSKEAHDRSSKLESIVFHCG